jgi:hypothetical protein
MAIVRFVEHDYKEVTTQEVVRAASLEADYRNKDTKVIELIGVLKDKGIITEDEFLDLLDTGDVTFMVKNDDT